MASPTHGADPNANRRHPNIVGAGLVVGLLVGAAVGGAAGDFGTWVPVFGVAGVLLALGLRRLD